jgi:hypothetical protein
MPAIVEPLVYRLTQAGDRLDVFLVALSGQTTISNWSVPIQSFTTMRANVVDFIRTLQTNAFEVMTLTGKIVRVVTD